MIRKRGRKYVLYSKKTGRRLGTHSSKRKAKLQEYAIKMAKKRRRRR